MAREVAAVDTNPVARAGRTRRLVVGSVVLLLLAGCLDDAPLDTGTAAPEDPGDCIAVDIAVSSEKIELITDLARTFNAASADENYGDAYAVEGRCVFVRPAVKASGAAASLLSEGWDESAEGPRPVVWSPASSSWGALVNHRPEESGETPIVGDAEPFMLTPLVIAMPAPMAAAIGYPGTPVGWSDVLAMSISDRGWDEHGHPEWGPFKLGKTNPHFSTSGLSALIAQYYAATGKTSGLTTEDVQHPDAVTYAAGIETSVTHYGDTTLTFLRNLHRNDLRGSAMNYASAVAVEEVSVIHYNRGTPEGTVAPGDEPEPPRVPLVAIYPHEGTLFSDNPYIVLDAEWVSQEETVAAEAFGDYLQLEENQARVLAFGFRPGNPAVPLTGPFGEDLGVDPDQPQTTLQVPEPQVLAAVLDQWDTHRKAARVLLTIDVSGSMGQAADTGTDGQRSTRLDLAKRSAIRALDNFRDDDEVGLRLFTSGLDGPDSEHYVDAVEIGPMGANRERLKEALENLVPLNGTPLYAAVAESYLDLLDGYDSDKINAVVVLSDGEDDGRSGVGLGSLLGTLATGGEGATVRDVRVFLIGFGEDAEMTTLRRIADATDAAAYDATDPRSIDKVFESVVSNF
jgi:Ca-activated chloride channel homolog